jgi:inner membrane transporter RhtA
VHRRLDRVPPQAFFGVSAVFHYLGPSLAVLLFARLDVLGVAWLRVASAAAVFALWRRPWRRVRPLGRGSRRTLLALGAVLAVMNTAFYLAVDRLPLSTVGAIEFLGTVILAAAGARTPRNAAALILTTAGVAAITAIRITGQPLGFVFAFANCALFMLYIVLGHRIANEGGPGGIDRLGAAMLIAAVVATPWGLGGALPGSACARRSSPTSPTSWPWPGCPGPRSPSCWRCCRCSPPSSARSCSASCLPSRTSPGSPW